MFRKVGLQMDTLIYLDGTKDVLRVQYRRHFSFHIPDIYIDFLSSSCLKVTLIQGFLILLMPNVGRADDLLIIRSSPGLLNGILSSNLEDLDS